MAFDTCFNILWNQRVAKEESSMLKFLDKRKQEEKAKLLESRATRRGKRQAMSDADLMSAVASVRESACSSAVGAPVSRSRRQLSASESDLHRPRSKGSGAGSSVLRRAGSQCSSSPSIRRKRPPPMTFEQMQETVFNQCMNRYIKDLEVEAKEATVEQEWMKNKIKDGHQQERDEKDRKRTMEKENQEKVRAQIEENKGRRADSRKTFVESASAHNFPLFTETFISQDEVDEYRKNVKKQFREELDRQQKTTQTLKNVIQKQDQIYAAEKRESNIRTMQKDHKKEHDDKIAKGQEMMRVWDRDIRLKNIKNAILNGKDATKEMGLG
jgi:hypothetical protein|mmetsp:Transcript_10600/g.17357  ORF Transcript_10600/g.17357 Transcript_10600/m.17357 type:complete len:327 (-) Transcript_10600:62-1042(-)|eukprot:CAMPEP_0169102896 /NCGR_PEP_ID=MMETSP1015-20121227/22417_1 /TAXON_ID=342587 /ORGANISM="Karlodinium micrum, Strain CCMP2283" /LENGTH=326 /DNA_ID=CAMNT_0009164039 /DNA_START=100 /DNA_END=1080 /DNA_ORIENTATION=-